MYFQLYAHNIPVRGRDRSAIYDLHNAGITFIPNVLVDILTALDRQPLAAVRAAYGYDTTSFDKYLAFLQHKDLGGCNNEPEAFPRLTLAWNQPGLLSSAIVVHDFRHYDFAEVAAQLDALHCPHLELRLSRATPARLAGVAQALAHTAFRSVTILLEYTPAVSPEVLRALYVANPKISRLLCHSAPFSATDAVVPALVLTQWKLADAAHTLPAPKYVVNAPFFAEAQHRNPYYNGKVCISRKGLIQNSLAQQHAFGQLPRTPLAQVVSRADFQELWFAAPDAIEELKDSPLRYCTYLARELRRTTSGYAVADTPEPRRKAATGR